MTTFPATTAGVAGTPSATPHFDSFPDNALELIASADDGDYGEVTTNATDDYYASWLFDNTPSDFGNMDTCFIRLRYGWSATPTNTTWPLLTARIVSGATILAANDVGGAYATVEFDITDTTPTNGSVREFAYVNTTATKAQWDAAELQISIGRARAKGGGSEAQRVYAGEITGTYTIAAAGVSIPIAAHHYKMLRAS